MRIGLHSGPPSPGNKGAKVAFFAKDVARLRETLVKRGVKFGKVGKAPYFLCDGRDPDGNPIQLTGH